MYERSEGTDGVVGGVADAMSLRTWLRERVVMMAKSLRNAWQAWRIAREARARDLVLRQQLAKLNPRMLDDIGIPASRVEPERSGSGMSAAIDIQVNEWMQRQVAEARPLTDDAAQALDAIAPSPGPSPARPIAGPAATSVARHESGESARKTHVFSMPPTVHHNHMSAMSRGADWSKERQRTCHGQIDPVRATG